MSRIVFNVVVAVNMLLCSILFFPWSRERETICGLMGRWLLDGNRWQKAVAGVLVPFLDKVFHISIEPCVEIAEMEEKAREALYPCSR